MKRAFLAASIFSLGFIATSSRAVLTETDSQQSTVYTVSSTDLLQTSLAGAPTSVGDFQKEGSGGVTKLNDGDYGLLGGGNFVYSATGGRNPDNSSSGAG